jgi:hypothetical protein
MSANTSKSSNGSADVPVNDGAKKPLTLARVYEMLNARFITSNGIPVERATLRADEWKLIQPIIRAARAATVTPIDCAAVEELVEAVKESRDALQAFANDGEPPNWIRHIAAEKRLDAALAHFGSAP